MISLRGPKLKFFASILAVIALCVSVYFIAVGAGILAFIIVSTILEKRSQERAAKQRELSGFTGYAPSKKAAFL